LADQRDFGHDVEALPAAEVAFALFDVFPDFGPFVLVVAETVGQAGAFEIGEEASDDGVDGTCDFGWSVQSSSIDLAIAVRNVFFLSLAQAPFTSSRLHVPKTVIALLLPSAAPSAVNAAATTICSPRQLLISLLADL
jgi:hypothetical protein